MLKFAEDAVGVPAVLVSDSWLKFLKGSPICVAAPEWEQWVDCVGLYTERKCKKGLRKWKDKGFF